MFNWFKKKKEEDPLKHFKPEWIPQEDPEVRYYSLGPTSWGRVMLKIAYGNVSLNEDGINKLIKALEASKMWLNDSGKLPEDACQSEGQPV